MMRILHVIQPPRGGAVTAMLLLAREQVAYHEVGVVCHSAGEAAERARSFGACVWTLPVARAVKPRDDGRHLRRLHAIVREFAPDVMHVHSSKAAALGRLAARLSRVPVVFSPQNFAYRAYEGAKIARLAFYIVERALSPLTDCLHVVGQDEYEDAVKRRMVTSDRCGKIHNGIDLARLLEMPPPQTNDAPVIGSFARLFEQKRLDVFLDALAELRCRGVPFRGLLIGDGPLRSDLVRRTAALRLNDIVDLDHAAHDTLEALQRIDIFALTSSHDACPLTVMEAMAAQRPVVATRVGGVPEIVTDGSSGLLVPFGDPRLVADALQRLVENPVRRQALAAAGREKARRRFGADVMSRRMEALYATAIARHHRRRRLSSLTPNW